MIFFVLLFSIVSVLTATAAPLGSSQSGKIFHMNGYKATLPDGLIITGARVRPGGWVYFVTAETGLGPKGLGSLYVGNETLFGIRQAEVYLVEDSEFALLVFHIPSSSEESKLGVEFLMILDSAKKSAPRFLHLILRPLSEEEEDLVMKFVRSVETDQNQTGYDPAG